MQTDAAHQSPWKTAHVIFGFTLLLGLGLHLYMPLSVHNYLTFISLKAIGLPLLVIGTLIIIVSKRDLEINDQPSEPKAATSMLVTTGMFRFSRNPLYLGLFISFCGLAFTTDKLWWLILAPLALVLTQRLLIQPEEKYLERKFSKEYIAYKKNTRRWL